MVQMQKTVRPLIRRDSGLMKAERRGIRRAGHVFTHLLTRFFELVTDKPPSHQKKTEDKK